MKYENLSVALILAGFFVGIHVSACVAQSGSTGGTQTTHQNDTAVNWLYGAYVPKDYALSPLSSDQRWRLFVKQSFTTPGIYVKSGFFTIHDQIQNSPPEWGQGFEGFGKRLGTRQTEYLLQNSFVALGDAALGWEPRYDRCKCDGAWPRSRHAIVRNFVTYDRSESHLRPQLMPYIGGFAAGAITASWKPGDPNLPVKGYQSAATQLWVGSLSNLVGEFAPDLVRLLKRKKAKF